VVPVNATRCQQDGVYRVLPHCADGLYHRLGVHGIETPFGNGVEARSIDGFEDRSNNRCR
jgi:hypothetical protein